MGLNKSEQKTYLTIGFGKLRQKTKVMAEGVTERKTQDGEPTLAYEFDSIDGIITNIYYKESKDYGNSFEVQIEDDKIYVLSFKEDSRYCHNLLVKLPKIDFDKKVRIMPYDFMDKQGKPRRGITIWQDDVKLDNTFFQKKDGEEWKYYHGYPVPGPDMNDKKLKIYFINVQDFLYNYTIKEIIPKFKYERLVKQASSVASDNTIDNAETIIDDDLPF